MLCLCEYYMCNWKEYVLFLLVRVFYIKLLDSIVQAFHIFSGFLFLFLISERAVLKSQSNFGFAYVSFLTIYCFMHFENMSLGAYNLYGEITPYLFYMVLCYPLIMVFVLIFTLFHINIYLQPYFLVSVSCHIVLYSCMGGLSKVHEKIKLKWVYLGAKNWNL